MFKGIIEKLVMARVKAKIQAAEKKYEEGLQALQVEMEQKQLELQDKLVTEVIGNTI